MQCDTFSSLQFSLPGNMLPLLICFSCECQWPIYSFEKAQVWINSLAHDAKSIKRVQLMQMLLRHFSLGHREKSCLNWKYFWNRSRGDYFIFFPQFSLSSALIKQTSFCLCYRRKAALLRNFRFPSSITNLSICRVTRRREVFWELFVPFNKVSTVLRFSC